MSDTLRAKLAEEILGWTWVRQDDGKHFYRYPSVSLMALPESHWFPDEDVSQAIRCLQALEAKGWRWAIDCEKGSSDVQLRNPADLRWTRSLGSEPIAKAICLAIACAFKWETAA